MGTGSRHSPTRPLLRILGSCLCLSLLAYFLFSGAHGASSSSSRVASRRCAIGEYDAAATTELDLKHCGLTELPATIGRFHALVKLDVSHNPELRQLPDALPPSLTTLFALGTGFETIPPAVAALPAIRMLSFKSCRLRDVGALPLPSSLVWLILTDNELVALPASFGGLTRMRKLMLANNRIQALPPSMAAMAELELLRLANNQLAAIPPWLLQLPRLTWLALAGNPCVAPAPVRAALPQMRFGELTVGDRLGEGTSSVVYKGVWRGGPVALKVSAHHSSLNTHHSSLITHHSSRIFGSPFKVSAHHSARLQPRAA